MKEADLLLSTRAKDIQPSNIRTGMKATAKATAAGSIVQLAQGLPEFPAAEILKMAGIAAIEEDHNQYCDTWGHPPLREEVASKYWRHYGIKVDPEREVTITCGVSEAVNIALLAVINPGDEVIVIEPFYENYVPNVITAGGVVRFVPLDRQDWSLDATALRRAFNSKTKAIIINNPHNPTGKVFSRAEMELICDLCQRWNVLAICDEIYEHMVYDGKMHVPLSAMPGMEDRTFTCSGLSKTFNVTGWRIGWVIAPPVFTAPVRRLHDYLTLAAPTPFQYAGIQALQCDDGFYGALTAKYTALRDQLSAHIERAGLPFVKPSGTYFIFADSSGLGFKNDRQVARYFLSELKLAVVAGFGFFRERARTNHVRFCFAKYPGTLDRAGQQLALITR
jgi:aminotransferase